MRILVIKLSALGDVVQALAPMKTIRGAHPDAHITVLTTPPYAAFLKASGLFDAVETDGRPKGLKAHLDLFARLRKAKYDRVYDLQTSSRSKKYFYAFLPRPPEWSGISPGPLRQTRPDRDYIHNLDRMADQLHVAGIAPALPLGEAPLPDLSFAKADPEAFGLTRPYVLLVPGASAVKPEKLWPVENYALVAKALAARGYAIGIVGGPSEAPLAAAIRQMVPEAVDLIGKTDFLALAGLGTQAAAAVGNDTGPAHVIAYAGAPGVMLLSRASDPVHCLPRGRTTGIRRDDLCDVGPDEVLAALKAHSVG